MALLIYGYYMAAFRNRPPLHPVSFLAVGVGLGTLFLLPRLCCGKFAQGKSRFALDARNNGDRLAFLWVFPSTIGYLFLNRGVELIGANRAAPFIHLVPVFGSVIAVAFLGRAGFELYHAIGYALVVCRRPRWRRGDRSIASIAFLGAVKHAENCYALICWTDLVDENVGIVPHDPLPRVGRASGAP